MKKVVDHYFCDICKKEYKPRQRSQLNSFFNEIVHLAIKDSLCGPDNEYKDVCKDCTDKIVKVINDLHSDRKVDDYEN